MVIEDKELDTQDLLRMMDVASAIRKQGEEVKQQFNLEETKLDLRKRILAATEFTGEKLTEAQADKAIESYLSGLYCFKEPKHNFFTGLANLYVDRVKIAKRVGIPIAVFLSMGALITGGIKGCTAISLHYQERKVETAVEKAYQDKRDLETDLVSVRNSPFRKQVPDSAMLESLVNNAEGSLKSTDRFFDKYCSKGTASDDISQKNYSEANAQLQPVLGSLTNARRGETVVIEAIENEKQLSILPVKAEQLFSSIKTEAREKEAVNLGEKFYNDSQASAKSRDITELKNSIAELENVDATLRQQYTITVVSREGEKSGIDRYYTDEKGKRLAGFYLIVEALDKSGSALEKRIKNEEDGKTYEVTMWGERVPEAVYEGLKQDKLDNGRIDNNIFGIKDKGYLNEKVTMKDENERQLKKLGEITQW